MGLEILGDDTECLEAALMNHIIAVANGEKGNQEKAREYTYKNMAFIKNALSDSTGVTEKEDYMKKFVLKKNNRL